MQDILENIFSIIRGMGGGCSNPDFGQLADRLRIVSLTRCDNIPALLSDSCKYEFEGGQGEAELDAEFGCDTFVNLADGLQDESDESLEDDEEIDMEATRYVAGYITHKVRVTC